MNTFAATLALIVERLAGYPKPVLDAIGHPVIWMGKLIEWLEARLNRADRPDRWRRVAGIVMLDTLLIATLVASLVIVWLTSLVPEGWIIQAVLATSLLAQKELARAVRAVADALDQSLEAGRRAVSHIVGRDPETLDAPGVARAAIETLAENASDGVVAPLFWMVVFGLPGIALYKAINTADSMVGHKDARYLHFGWASARLDDFANWIPARLTGFCIAGTSLLVSGASARDAWGAMFADASKHQSPNAGWPEAAMAGALGSALGGPRAYAGKVIDLPKMGRGRTDLTSADIRKALELFAMLLNVVLGLTAGLAVLTVR